MSDTISSADYLARFGGVKAKKPKTSKLRNEPTIYGGRLYASKKEARRAEHLDWRKHLGEIEKWEPQVPFSLDINGVHICTYILDFLITNPDGSKTYEDAKGQRSGVPYQLFKVKKHLMKAIYDIDVIEV